MVVAVGQILKTVFGRHLPFTLPYGQRSGVEVKGRDQGQRSRPKVGVKWLTWLAMSSKRQLRYRLEQRMIIT